MGAVLVALIIDYVSWHVHRLIAIMPWRHP